jgi:hypothetical protein
MSTVKVVDIVVRAKTLLLDTTATRWTGVELQYWLNDSYREIVNLRPDANSTSGTFTCVAGYRQNLITTFAPTANRLLEVIANKAALSNKKGVRLVSRRSLDTDRPGWYNEQGSINTELYVYDPRFATEFLVYPPALTTTQLEIVYNTIPTPHTLTESQLNNLATTEVIKLSDSYANAILDYMLYRAYSKDSDQQSNASRAVAHYQAFTSSLGVKTQSDQAAQPGVA